MPGYSPPDYGEFKVYQPIKAQQKQEGDTDIYRLLPVLSEMQRMFLKLPNEGIP